MRAFLSIAPFFVAGVVVAACGGKSAGQGGPSSSSSGSGGGNGCTLVACDDGLHVDFSFRDPGTYVVEGDIDGTPYACKATLPLPQSPPTACDRPDVLLTLSGSMLPADQQSIGGLLVTATSAKRVAVRVTRDGTPVASADFEPVPWVTSPGPNGPGCEPSSCTSARVTLGTQATPGQGGFACGAQSCDPSAEICVKASGNGGPATYSCVSSSTPGQGASSGGPLPVCKPTDCACITSRLLASLCQGGASCTITNGHAYVDCNSGG